MQLDSDENGVSKFVLHSQPLVPVVDFVADCVVITDSLAERVDAYVLHTYDVFIVLQLRLLLVGVLIVLFGLIQVV